MKPITDVLVLLSGGQDSTTCLAWARKKYTGARLHALTMLYGQRHATEVTSAKSIAKLLGCATHTVLDLSGVFAASGSALLSKSQETIKPDGGLADVAAPNGLPTSFVPGRNLVFMAIAGAHAAALGAGTIVTGVCQTDYSGYPDCRAEFVDAMSGAVNEAMPTAIRPILIEAPLMRRTKAETVAMMIGLAKDETVAGRMVSATFGVPQPSQEWQQTDVWRALGTSVTCYRGCRPGCATCPACLLRAKGFDEAGVPDPARSAAFDPALDQAVSDKLTEMEFDPTVVQLVPDGLHDFEERDVIAHDAVPMIRRDRP
jgi:7-cyano-7-deazaguanine synthase